MTSSTSATEKDIAIHWFRQDLRITDNPALIAASAHTNVLPIYILDNDNAAENRISGASQVWLHHSLDALNTSLDRKLSVYEGDAKSILRDLISRFNISAVYWNRCYEPWRIKRDKEIKDLLKKKGLVVKSFNGSLLWEPWKIQKNDGSSFKVFTPFYRKGCLKAPAPRAPLEKVTLQTLQHDSDKDLTVKGLKLIPKLDWPSQMMKHWPIGESGAQKTLQRFIDQGLASYKQERNIPAIPGVSRLSPYLHFGEISPHQVWNAARNHAENKHVDHFCSEIGWREFSYHLLYHQPTLATKNLQDRFDHFDWHDLSGKQKKLFDAWKSGHTGIPMVDAGMRELWQTGYMHNRARMIVASYLTKNLNIHWRHGERWFWETLLDADLANNSASWQWVAGSGADPVAYFRIFNPMLQGRKFDPEGTYIRRYVPEISALPDEYLYNPWEAPLELLTTANIELGKVYPKPIVDFEQTRQEAQQRFDSLPENSA